MKNRNSIPLFLFLLLFIAIVNACKKTDTQIPQPTAFVFITPPNFPNDLPSGFKRVFIQSPVGYLNMRAGPDTNSVIICQIPNNEVIYVENEDKLWLSAVRPKDNSQGYVNSGRLGEFAFPFGRNR
jgi:hypothetical protein